MSGTQSWDASGRQDLETPVEYQGNIVTLCTTNLNVEYFCTVMLQMFTTPKELLSDSAPVSGAKQQTP